jgi:hypothetical protein
MDKYPIEEELKKIEEWPMKDYRELLDFIHSIWEYAEWTWSEEKLKDAVEYNISTAGWSGNEDLIRAMQNNEMFWKMCWQQSKRGGHYIFHVR